MTPDTSDLRPVLQSDLRRVSQLAMSLHGLVSALNACIDDPDRKSICIHMIESAEIIAADLDERITMLGCATAK